MQRISASFVKVDDKVCHVVDLKKNHLLLVRPLRSFVIFPCDLQLKDGSLFDKHIFSMQISSCRFPSVSFRLSCIKIVRIFTWKRIGANNWINPGSFSTSAYAHKENKVGEIHIGIGAN